MLQNATNRAAVATHMGALALVDSMQGRLTRAANGNTVGAYIRYQAWIILIGVVVFAVAAAWAWCQ